MADYFVVGPSLTLQGAVRSGATLRIPVYRDREETGAEVTAVCREGWVDLACSGVPLDPPLQLEAVRLLARLAQRLSPAELPLRIGASLAEIDGQTWRADGFAPAHGAWIRPRGPFLRRLRTPSLEEVYRDPFTIPWNFVPREVECMQPILELIAHSARPLRVLDLGFGFAKNATFLEERGCEVFGVEISASATERARKLVRHPERFLNASARRLPFRDGFFDAALDVGCLHCTAAAERRGVVEEAHRVLRPDGLISSRIFRPQEPAWVERQPFEAVAFGLTEAEALALFRPSFSVRLWRDDPDMLYLRGTRDAA